MKHAAPICIPAITGAVHRVGDRATDQVSTAAVVKLALCGEADQRAVKHAECRSYPIARTHCVEMIYADNKRQGKEPGYERSQVTHVPERSVEKTPISRNQRQWTGENENRKTGGDNGHWRPK